MKKWSTPTMVTVSKEQISGVMVASACPLYDIGCDIIRAWAD